MPFPAARPIDALGVAHMQGFQHTLQPVVSCRDDNQVYVVGHEAVCEHFNLVFVAVLSEPQQVSLAIFVREKDVFAPIAALGHVMWNICKYGSGKSGHNGRLTL